MSQVFSQLVSFVVSIFKFHKKKIAFLSGAIAFWFLVLFPYDDLSDFVTLKITQATQSRVYLQFEGLGFALFPQLGIKMDDVILETTSAPTLAVKSLGIAPGFSTILRAAFSGGNLKPKDINGRIVANGLLGGDLTADVSYSNKLGIDGVEKELEIEIESMSLKEVSKLLAKNMNFPVTMNGKSDLFATVAVDPNFKVQPDGTVKLTISNLSIPASTIQIPFPGSTIKMNMSFPALKLDNIEVEGSVRDGTFLIKKGKIGSQTNDLNGEVTGELDLRMLPGPVADIGGYNLNINLNVSHSLKGQLSAVLGIVDGYENIGDKYKIDSLTGVRYNFRLQATRKGMNPTVSSAK